MISYQDIKNIIQDRKYEGLSSRNRFIKDHNTYLFSLPRRSGKTNLILEFLHYERSSMVFVPRYEMMRPFSFYERLKRAHVSYANIRGYTPVEYILLEEYKLFNENVEWFIDRNIEDGFITRETKIIGFSSL